MRRIRVVMYSCFPRIFLQPFVAITTFRRPGTNNGLVSESPTVFWHDTLPNRRPTEFLRLPAEVILRGSIPSESSEIMSRGANGLLRCETDANQVGAGDCFSSVRQIDDGGENRFIVPSVEHTAVFTANANGFAL